MRNGRFKSRISSASSTAAAPSRRGIYLHWGFAVALGIVSGVLGTLLFSRGTSAKLPAAIVSETTAGKSNFFDLLSKTPRELEHVDVAEMNLLCAVDLPGAENLDVQKCLKTLDEWAEKVRFDTQRHYYKFRQNPAEFDNSEGEYCMMMLITVLQQDCGVHYNKERITNVDFKNAKDLFIFGMIGDDNGGTCVCMPVLYTAVARRLRWPVKLALAKGHVFCRWESDKERFNIEGSGRGFIRRDDEHFKKWPQPISEAEVKAGLYLTSLTPPEELAAFLAARGHCLEDTGRMPEARVAYATAHQLAPKSPIYFAFLENVVSRHGINFVSPRRPTSSPVPNPHDPLSPAVNPPLRYDVTHPVPGQPMLPTQFPFQSQGGLP